ncbi:MAG: P1 family peptidase [Acidimicrobiales bacterium]
MPSGDPAGRPAQKGAGTGATVGKWRGAEYARPGGLGVATLRSGDVVVTALIAVNAVGDLVGSPEAADLEASIARGTFEWPAAPPLGKNTTIGVVATNAVLTKLECFGLANAAHDGLARAIIPSHTPYDGDAIVVVAKPEVEAPVAGVRTLAAAAVERAILSTR